MGPTKVSKWEKRWVMVPNVFHYGKEVWVQKYLNKREIQEVDQTQRDHDLIES